METDALVSHIDIIPTLMDIMGIDPKPYKLPGVSYATTLLNPKKEVQDHVSGAWAAPRSVLGVWFKYNVPRHPGTLPP